MLVEGPTAGNKRPKRREGGEFALPDRSYRTRIARPYRRCVLLRRDKSSGLHARFPLRVRRSARNPRGRESSRRSPRRSTRGREMFILCHAGNAIYILGVHLMPDPSVCPAREKARARLKRKRSRDGRRRRRSSPLRMRACARLTR